MVAACFESLVSSSISQMVMEINVNPRIMTCSNVNS